MNFESLGLTAGIGSGSIEAQDNALLLRHVTKLGKLAEEAS